MSYQHQVEVFGKTIAAGTRMPELLSIQPSLSVMLPDVISLDWSHRPPWPDKTHPIGLACQAVFA